MTTAALALVAAALALAVAVAAVGSVLAARRRSEARLTEGLLEMTRRLDALASELAQTVEKVQEDALRTRLTESLGRALDVDEVMARCAEAAVSLPGVGAAAVSVEVDGVPLVAAVGLDSHLIEAIAGPPDGGSVRAVGLSYHYAEERARPDAILSALAVPLETPDGRLGFLTVFGRTEEPPVAAGDFQLLEAIARHAGPAIQKAARDTGGRPRQNDGLTGFGSRRSCHETLAHEVARAHRRGHRLALCVLDIDDFKEWNSRLGQVAGDRLVAEVAELIRQTIRPGDLAFRSGGDEFSLILPESGRIDAEAAYARLQASLRRRPSADRRALSVSAGIAELVPDDDGVSLFERAERALHRAKGAGKGTAA